MKELPSTPSSKLPFLGKEEQTRSPQYSPLSVEEVLNPLVVSGDPKEDQGRLQGITYHLQGQSEGTTTFIGLSVATPSSLEPSGGSEGGAALGNALGRRGRGEIGKTSLWAT